MTSTELRRREPEHRSSNHRSRLIWSAGALLVLAAFGVSCDTTAKISFPSRSFNDIHSTGMSAPANACGALGGSGGSTTKLRFVMVADDDTPIRPPSKGGSALDSGEVMLNKDKMSYNREGGVYENPDLKCGGSDGGDTNGGDTKTYKHAILPYDGTCGGQFSCSVGVSDGDSSLQRCRLDSSYNVEGVEHTADVEEDQLFGVLVENAGSLEGFPPGDSQGWYYDDDGNGEADQKVEQSRDRATDWESNRVTALKELAPNWVRAQKAADDRDTFFGLWTYNFSEGTTSIVDEASEDDTNWTDDKDVLERATTEAGPSTDGVYPSRTQGGTRGNVLDAIERTINDDFQGEGVPDDADKTLVVFTDGPPEVHPDRHGTTADAVIQAADAANVRIFMIHLDDRVGNGKAEGVLDDLQYYQSQEEQCGDDSDCQAHETCRKVRGYSTQQGGDVTADVNGRYHDQGLDATYCMPQRRADGRTGPLSIYSKIACATEGGYQYFKTNTEITWAMDWLPYTMDGLWEADVSVRELENGNFTPNAPTRLQARFNVTVGDRDVGLNLTQISGDRDPNIPESGDHRSVIVTGESN